MATKLRPSWAPTAAVMLVRGVLLLVLLTFHEVRPAAPPPEVGARSVAWHGWTDAVLLTNGLVEVVVVPSIGRVMAFQFAGQTSPFWHDPALRGAKARADSTEWVNFGGDKTWPAPQDEWPKRTGRGWPPPATFDAVPLEMAILRPAGVRLAGAPKPGPVIQLRSPTDPHYGIRTTRQVMLHPRDPAMTIETVYEKIEGEPVSVSVWVVTQLAEADGIYVPLPRETRFAEGYNAQWKPPASNVLRADGWLRFVHDPSVSQKLGSDGAAMIWVGRETTLRIDFPRSAGVRYPDNDSNIEIYTNPDPKRYIEFETLGPLRTLRKGERLKAENRYRLSRRVEADPAREAHRMMERR